MVAVLVISDIHANLPALEAVLESVDEEEFLFCGDIVGYYPWPNRALERVEELDLIAVLGNHDEALVRGSTFGFSDAAAEALRWTEKEATHETLERLSRHPYIHRDEVEGKDILMVHGSPRRPMEKYVRPAEVDAGFLDRQKIDVDILLLGHTHVPFVKEVKDTLVINPGSIGQPRDGDSRASYAVLDVEEKEAEIVRQEYDIERVKEAVREEGLPKHLGRRLSRGR